MVARTRGHPRKRTPGPTESRKYNRLVANALMFYNTVTLANDLRGLIQDGYHVEAACVAALSPYAIKDLERFGRYTLNLDQPPDAVDYDTPVVSEVPLPAMPSDGNAVLTQAP